MKIRATTLLKVEDFNDQKDWIGKMIQPINDFVSQSIAILNGGLLFTDQMIGVDHTFEFTYQSDAITLPQRAKWTSSYRPGALVVVAATEDGAPIIPAVAWKYTQEGVIEVTSMVKLTTAPAVALLTAGAKYRIRCRITP
jgi:hypothetical protein